MVSTSMPPDSTVLAPIGDVDLSRDVEPDMRKTFGVGLGVEEPLQEQGERRRGEIGDMLGCDLERSRDGTGDRTGFPAGQQLKARGIGLKEPKEVDDRGRRRHGARLVLRERPRSATQQLAGLDLRQPETLANGPDLFRRHVASWSIH